MSSGGKDNRGNRRRHFRRHEREKAPSVPQETRKDAPREAEAKSKNSDRPRWTPPKLSTEPLPAPGCPYCGKPIKDISLAISDKNSGEAVHFDCVIARLNQGENLEPGDTISYLGGGRFGVVHVSSNNHGFSIKKVFEWENKENRAEWRQAVSDHFSVT
jgi:hypothetical protein